MPKDTNIINNQFNFTGVSITNLINTLAFKKCHNNLTRDL